MYIHPHIHISEETIKRKPWLLVIIGLVGVLFFGFCDYLCLVEYLKFSKIKQPETISVERVELTQTQTTRWVTLTNFQWHPEATIIVERDAPESWIFGKVDSTQILLADSSGHKLIAVKFDGLKPVSELPQDSITGILTFEGNRGWSNTLAPKLKISTPKPIQYVLSGGAKPSDLIYYILFFSGVIPVYLAFSWFYFKRWRQVHTNSEKKKARQV